VEEAGVVLEAVPFDVVVAFTDPFSAFAVSPLTAAVAVDTDVANANVSVGLATGLFTD